MRVGDDEGEGDGDGDEFNAADVELGTKEGPTTPTGEADGV